MESPQALLAQAFEKQRQHQYESAEALYSSALAKDPNNAQGWYYRAINAQNMMRDDIAVECFSRCLALGGGGNIHELITHAYIQLHQEEKAKRHANIAIQLNPKNTQLQIMLATTYITQRKLEEATDLLEKTIKSNPDCFEAYRLLAKVKKLKPDEALSQVMIELARQSANTTYPLDFGLADIYHSDNQRDKYWQHLERANKKQLALAKQQMPEIIAQFERIKRGFSSPISTSEKTETTSETSPIFIVGLPRSGTTLVEQLLAGHNDVYAGDELPYMRGVVARQLPQMTQQPFPLGIESVGKEQLTFLAAEYNSRIKRLSGGSNFVTDKNPENFFVIGVIAKLFPNAKIVRISRDPMDVCFSIYNQCTSYAVPYFNDLENMAEFILAYQKLMAHWDNVCGERIFDLTYEDLINTPSQTGKAVFDYCGLEWREEFLDFHTSNKTVRSLTSLQVRQPIHSKSIGKWRDFKVELAVATDKLA